MNRLSIKLCFATQLIGRVIMYPIVPLAFAALALPELEQLFLYLIHSMIIFCCLAIPVYLWGAFQKCSLCNKRILILPNGTRRPELTKSITFWYLNFVEPIEMMKSHKIPCHHCGEVVEYNKG